METCGPAAAERRMVVAAVLDVAAAAAPAPPPAPLAAMPALCVSASATTSSLLASVFMRLMSSVGVRGRLVRFECAASQGCFSACTTSKTAREMG